jgi:rhamnulokinase
MPGDMPARINVQRKARGLPLLVTDPTGAPVMARLIFESLADRYARLLKSITQVSGKQLRRLYIVGGGSQNKLLNRLTQQATGLEVLCGAVESSTVGNFAVQLAVLEGDIDPTTGVDRAAVAHWAALLQ